MGKHEFGGPWTIIKLDILGKYLNFYTKALRAQPFDLRYIDAFAGTGECFIKDTSSGAKTQIRGSAKIALDVQPPFGALDFIDSKRSHFKQIEKLTGAHPNGRAANLWHEDANIAVKQICAEEDWEKWRGVLFIDPYGMAAQWKTLEAVAATQAVDVWYLLPIGGIIRQLARNFSNVDGPKQASLDAIFGTHDWFDAFYKTSDQLDLFNAEPGLHRHMEIDEIERWVTQRLKSVFPSVLSPVRLYNGPRLLFSLYFAVSNPDPKAIGLANKVAKYITGPYK